MQQDRYFAPSQTIKCAGYDPESLLVIVPAIRAIHESTIGLTAETVSRCGAKMLALCSKNVTATQVANEICDIPGLRYCAVDMQPGVEEHELLTFPTTGYVPRVGQTSSYDLPAKKNIGNFAAIAHGDINAMFFVDDDLDVYPTNLYQIFSKLGKLGVAGFICNEFPDDTVINHAIRRWAPKLYEQHYACVFGASGGAIAGHNGRMGYSVDGYGEGLYMLAHKPLIRASFSSEDSGYIAGLISQRPYDPFVPIRAINEEFWVTLANGFSEAHSREALQSKSDVLNVKKIVTNSDIWKYMIDGRHALITYLATQMTHNNTNVYDCLDAAVKRHNEFGPEDYIGFMEKWYEGREIMDQRIDDLSYENSKSMATVLGFFGLSPVACNF